MLSGLWKEIVTLYFYAEKGVAEIYLSQEVEVIYQRPEVVPVLVRQVADSVRSQPEVVLVMSVTVPAVQVSVSATAMLFHTIWKNLRKKRLMLMRVSHISKAEGWMDGWMDRYIKILLPF